jgi:tripartite-type tricarboxylate transporter receptor subunit TctC
MNTKPLVVAFALLAACAISPPSVAQTFPSKVVRIIVPQAAGGLNDLIAREIANELGAKWKLGVIVDARPGAGGTIAADAVAKAEPDGHTLLFTSPGPVIVSAFVTKNLRFDPATAFSPVFNVAKVPTVIVAKNALPVATLSDLVAYAKSRPGDVSYASSGAGSGLHFEAEIFAGTVDVKLLHIPYKSGTESVRAVVAGEADMALTSATQARGQITGGLVKGLAVSSRTRVPSLPSVPTVAEAGYPQLDLGKSWFGFFAPAGTPRAVVDAIVRDIGEVVRRPAFVERLVSQHGMEPMIQSSAEFSEQTVKDRAEFGALVKRLGFAAE